MTTASLIGLFGAMMVLAAVPGPAVFAIIARSFASGMSRCVYLILGTLVADYIFIMLALFGLSALAEMMGSAFVFIKYLSAAYLIWLGYKMLSTKAEAQAIEGSQNSSRISNFMTGLLITLGNPKAVLFYVGFFPAFVDVTVVEPMDIGIIMLTATVALSSVNLAYAYLAVRAKRVFKSPKALGVINKTAGTIMVSTGAVIAARV